MTGYWLLIWLLSTVRDFPETWRHPIINTTLPSCWPGLETLSVKFIGTERQLTKFIQCPALCRSPSKSQKLRMKSMQGSFLKHHMVRVWQPTTQQHSFSSKSTHHLPKKNIRNSLYFLLRADTMNSSLLEAAVLAWLLCSTGSGVSGGGSDRSGNNICHLRREYGCHGNTHNLLYNQNSSQDRNNTSSKVDVMEIW